MPPASTEDRRGEAATAQPGELLSLSSGRAPTGVVVTFTGELDLASAERAFGYVRDVIDRHNTLVGVSTWPRCAFAMPGAWARSCA